MKFSIVILEFRSKFSEFWRNSKSWRQGLVLTHFSMAIVFILELVYCLLLLKSIRIIKKHEDLSHTYLPFDINIPWVMKKYDRFPRLAKNDIDHVPTTQIQPHRHSLELLGQELLDCIRSYFRTTVYYRNVDLFTHISTNQKLFWIEICS